MTLLSFLPEPGAARAWTRFDAPLAKVAAVIAAIAAILGLGLLTVSLSANPSDAAIAQHRAALIAAQARGDFSDARLQAMMAAGEPGAAALAARMDPGVFRPVASVGPESLDPGLLGVLSGLDQDQAAAVNAGVPFSIDPNPPARPFSMRGVSAQDRDRALGCLAQAVYYEAGFEPLEGAQAVAQVVLNRVRHPAFPKTVCGVVYEGATQHTGCQFSFTCDGSLARPPAPAAWQRARDVADHALNGFVVGQIGGATHYHAQYVVPYWAPTLAKVNQIGAHIFYRWPGDWGLPRAFNGRYAGGEAPGVDVGGDPLADHGAAMTTPAAAPPAPVIVKTAELGPPKLETAPAPVADLSDLTTDVAVPQLAPERPAMPPRLAMSR